MSVTAVFRRPLAAALTGAVLGALVALSLGLAAVALAPENGFADLAAAAVTRVILVPAGLVVGGAVGLGTARRRLR